jgi:quercetin dioxygenase-like cupin family protein
MSNNKQQRSANVAAPNADQRNSLLRIVLRTFSVAVAALLVPPGVWAQDQTQHHGPGMGQMRGMMGDHAPQDMQTIHALFAAREQITRTTKKLENGIETVTESEDVKVRALVREHVAAMYQRLSSNRPIHAWDPLFAELFKQASKIKMDITNTPKGVKVIETSTYPWVVKLLHAHAEAVSDFLKEGMPAMHKLHPLPDAAPEKTMQRLPLQPAIGTGEDKHIEQLFNGPRRRLVQIILRNGATLDAHKAAVPITIQCVAGSGLLQVGDAREIVELTPGVLVTIEPNIVHEIQARPAVSILLSQFTDR